MPVHDWSRIFAGGFHDFHQAWIAELRRALNRGILPAGYYAAAEQIAGGPEPDVLTLEAKDWDSSAPANSGGTSLAVADHPPRVRYSIEADPEVIYANRADRIVIRHASDHHVVAVIEIVSKGNKHSRQTVDDFLDKLWMLFSSEVHLLVIDLFGPTVSDPHGLPAAFWERRIDQPDGRVPFVTDSEPFSLSAWRAGHAPTCYIELAGSGSTLPDMPLFLTQQQYVNVPLEATYQEAWRDVPAPWKEIVAGS